MVAAKEVATPSVTVTVMVRGVVLGVDLDCDPVARAFQSGKLDRSGRGDTYADSINVAVPRNWRKAVHAVRESGGAFIGERGMVNGEWCKRNGERGKGKGE